MSWLAAATIAAPLVSNYLNQQMQRETNQQSLGMSREQMDWETKMSNTAHQREVADLKAAGLNPTLSTGKGASTPSASVPGLTAPKVEMPDFMAYGISKQQLENEAEKIATDKGRLQNETNLTAAQIAQINQQTKTKGFEQKISEAAQQAIDNAKKLISSPKIPDADYNFYQKPIKVNYEKRKQFDSDLKKSLNFGTSVQPKP